MRAFLIGASILALSACSGSDDPKDPNDPSDQSDPSDPSDPTDPSDPVDHMARDYDDVATAIGASTHLGDVAAMLDMMAISHGVIPADVTYLGMTDAEHQHATAVRGGVTFDFLYHCNDNNDVIVSQCNSTVDHSHFTIKVTGNVAGAMEMSGINTKGAFTVRDIDIVKPRVGGTNSLDFLARVNNADYLFAFDATIDRVRFEPSGVTPLSGKIDLSIMANRNRNNVTRDFTVAASLVFDGSAAAILTLDGAKNYSINLATGAATKL